MCKCGSGVPTHRIRYTRRSVLRLLTSLWIRSDRARSVTVQTHELPAGTGSRISVSQSNTTWWSHKLTSSSRGRTFVLVVLNQFWDPHGRARSSSRTFWNTPERERETRWGEREIEREIQRDICVSEQTLCESGDEKLWLRTHTFSVHIERVFQTRLTRVQLPKHTHTHTHTALTLNTHADTQWIKGFRKYWINIILGNNSINTLQNVFFLGNN